MSEDLREVAETALRMAKIEKAANGAGRWLIQVGRPDKAATTTGSVIPLLRAARSVLEPPGSWTQGDLYARKENGDPARIMDPDAHSWTIEGALRKVLHVDNGQFTTPEERAPFTAAAKLLAEAAGDAKQTDLHIVNERLTHPSALALSDRAISAAEARGE